MSCTNLIAYYSGIDAAVLGSAGLSTVLHDLIDEHTVVSTAMPGMRFPTWMRSSQFIQGGWCVLDHSHDAVTDRGIAEGWNREHSWPKSYGVDTKARTFRTCTPYTQLTGASTRQGATYTSTIARYRRDAPSQRTWRRARPLPRTRRDSVRPTTGAAISRDRCSTWLRGTMGVRPTPTTSPLRRRPTLQGARWGSSRTLVAWHDADPVSAAERTRNERICATYQHNRNPFIDHPEWVACIFSGGRAQTPSLPTAAAAGTAIVATFAARAGWVPHHHWDHRRPSPAASPKP